MKLARYECPQEFCSARIDVPEGSFDGSEFRCPRCCLPCMLAVALDGSWWLYDPEDES